MRIHWFATLVFGTLCANASPIVINGSFESPAATNIGSFLRVFSPSSAITGWTVSANNLDWIGTLWQASDGNRSLDMAGSSFGATILQDVTGFAVGQGYQLQFDLAGNTFSPNLKQLQVSVFQGAALVAGSTFSFNNSGQTLSNMGWQSNLLSFTSPVNGTLRLQFAGLNNDGAGAALDNIRLIEVAGNAIPEPATVGVFALGLTALAIIRHRNLKHGKA